MNGVNNLPRGFLSLLGLQTQGNYITSIADSMAGTMSLRDLLEYQLREHFTLSLTTAGAAAPAAGFAQFNAVAGPGGAVDVPSNELWLVIRSSLTITIIGGASTSGPSAFAYRENANVGYSILPGRRHFNGDALVGPAAGNNQYAIATHKGVFLPPGCQLGFVRNVASNIAAGGSEIVSCDMEIVRLRQ